MKPFLLALILCLFSLKMTAQSSEFLCGEYIESSYEDCDDCCDSHSSFDFSIFPNPTRDYFEIKLMPQNASPTEGGIYNALGQFIRRFNTTTTTDISDLSRGLYIIQIGQKVQKLIIQ